MDIDELKSIKDYITPSYSEIPIPPHGQERRELATPSIHRILEIEEESPTAKTFYFEYKKKNIEKIKPGNFLMIWVPFTVDGRIIPNKTGEKPISISDVGDDKIAISVKNLGPVTNELFNYDIGMQIGITGPLGNSFNIQGDKILVVGGGIGIAPLYYLSKELRVRHNKKLYCVIGAKNKKELIFINKMKEVCEEVIVTTDDGSFGLKGYASDHLPLLSFIEDIDQLYCCGPELMMAKVLEFSLKNNISSEFSTERYMHCGRGLCGFCSLDEYTTCKDGPVFNGQTLSGLKEFGRVKRDKSGKKINL